MYSFLGICILFLVSVRGKEEVQQKLYEIIHLGTCPVIVHAKCDGNYVKFYLYTREKADGYGEFVKFTETWNNVSDSHFKPNRKNIVIVHGYNADIMLNVLQNLKEEYLKCYDANVWMVDWSGLVPAPCYPMAVYNTRYAGRCLAHMLSHLMDAGSVWSQSSPHLVGFSVGAHVPAHTANYLRPLKLPRITGLDPALPLFVGKPLVDRLDSTDAKFVDIYHTNAFMEGQYEATGHADFFMNGGVVQPACANETSKLAWLQCGHHLAPSYFAESINSPVGFWGWSCPGYFSYFFGRCERRPPLVLMGEHMDTTLRGRYLVKTLDHSPYAINYTRLDERQSHENKYVYIQKNMRTELPGTFP